MFHNLINHLRQELEKPFKPSAVSRNLFCAAKVCVCVSTPGAISN